MSSSLNLTNAANLQAYVQTYDFNLLQRMFNGFHSAPFLTPHADVAGKLALTELILGDVVKRWKKTFEPKANAFTFKPTVLEVQPCKIDLELYPQEFRSTYLGHAQRQGFNSLDNPFEKYMIDGVMNKKDTEQDIAVWSGVQTNSPSDDDGMSLLFDGYLQLIKDALTAGDITAVSTGSLTLNDMVEQTESVYKGLNSAMRMKEVHIYMSVDNWALYAESYRENYSKNYTQKIINGFDAIKLDNGNAWVIPMPGMLTSDRIVATVAGNLHYGYKKESDAMLNFKDDIRSIKMWSDWLFGVQIGILHNDCIRVNNQE